jgi:hypothetical protein
MSHYILLSILSSDLCRARPRALGPWEAAGLLFLSASCNRGLGEHLDPVDVAENESAWFTGIGC